MGESVAAEKITDEPAIDAQDKESASDDNRQVIVIAEEVTSLASAAPTAKDDDAKKNSAIKAKKTTARKPAAKKPAVKATRSRKKLVDTSTDAGEPDVTPTQATDTDNADQPKKKATAIKPATTKKRTGPKKLKGQPKDTPA